MSWVVVSETVRRYFTSVAYWGFLAFLAIVAAGTARFTTPGSGWPSVVALLSIIAGCTPVGPEFSSGTLQLILVKPIKRSTYLLSRVAGVILVTWAAAAIGFLAEIAGRSLLAEPVAIRTLATTLLNTSVNAVLTVSLLTFFGSFTRAYFNVALYVVLQVALGMTIGLVTIGRRFPAIGEALQTVMNNLFPDEPPSLDRRWLLLVVSNAAVALVLACLVFRRREVPYGAD